MIHEGITTKRVLQVQRITTLYIKCQSSHDYLIIVDLTITGKDIHPCKIQNMSINAKIIVTEVLMP